MIRQVSAWGQFWADLSHRHKVHGCGIFTPLWHEPRPAHRGLYHSTWYRMHNGSPIYYQVDGDTMTDMLRDGLAKTGADCLLMRTALLALCIERVTHQFEARLHR